MNRPAFLVALCAALLVAPTSTVRAQAPVKLTMVGAWTPKVSAAADMGMRFMEEVNKRARGRLVVEFKGASEVVPTFDQPEALVRGVIDVWFGAPNYWAGVVPGGYVTELSKFDVPDNGPGSELFDFMVQMYERKGVRYLGHYTGTPTTGNHFMYTQKPVKTLADLKGSKIRVPPLTRFFVTAIGAEPVTLPPGEIYMALERGTVEGFTWPIFDGVTNFGWHEVAKFVIMHPLYRDGTGVAMNMAKWKSLPKDLQDIVHESVRAAQAWSQQWVAGHQTSQLAAMQKAGMKVLQFSPAEAERWSQTANDALWAQFKKVMSADDYARARKLLKYE